MQVKIVNCSKRSWWYFGLIGEIVDVSAYVSSHSGMEGNYHVTAASGASGYVSISDTQPVLTAPLCAYMHEGKSYDIKSWVKFVTCDKEGDDLYGWEFKPELTRCGYSSDSGKREVLQETLSPPVGAFITEIK